MLNIDTMEMIVLLLVAFVIVGPKDLPKVARFLGRSYRYLKNLIKEITASLDLEEELEAVKEITDTVKEIKGSAEDAKKKVQDVANPNNILAPIKKELSGVTDEIKTVAEAAAEIKESLQDNENT